MNMAVQLDQQQNQEKNGSVSMKHDLERSSGPMELLRVSMMAASRQLRRSLRGCCVQV